MRRRRIARLLVVGAACIASTYSFPGAASATEYHFCVGSTINSGVWCWGAQVSHWDRVRNRYAGHQNDNVMGCVSQWNQVNWTLRGGRDWCDWTWSSPTLNPMGHNWGDTYASQYYPRIYNGSSYTHTFTGWASDNQTDG